MTYQEFYSKILSKSNLFFLDTFNKNSKLWKVRKINGKILYLIIVKESLSIKEFYAKYNFYYYKDIRRAKQELLNKQQIIKNFLEK